MNEIKNVWKRILENCSTSIESPEIKFETISGIQFYIIKINETTIHPYRIDKNSKLFDITKEQIEDDLRIGRPLNRDNVSEYDTPAPSYRYALLHDPRIFIL